MFHTMAKCIFWILLLLTVRSVNALPSDKEQVMRMMADSADLSQHDHKGIYLGHVELIQGTTNIRAAKAITQGDEKNQLVLATAYGNAAKQAHYWVITDPKKPTFHAYADTINYYPLRHLIELVGNAHVEQGSNSFSAAKMTYDTLKQHVVSEGDTKQRVTIIYHPEKKPS